jgi:hypothetical protein
MSGRVGIGRAALTGVLVLAACVSLVFLLPGCGNNDQQLQDKYNEGYQAGVKAEQAKWSNEKLQLARTYIKEQEDSQENIRRLLGGEVIGITVDAVNVPEGSNRGQLEITARFRDGSTVKGVIDMVKIDSYWYMEKVTRTSGS